ncbi:MarR family winged helix-turn-helix transcriptional regulator [Cysteiniphilum sp. 6C5]|uniref:MarR family winged helix-turn-helix transcriptional regulator n=1 Tax=unclassified Cysteiniphilum TaxID=2610889 RepID=UPI003F84350C
MSDATTQLLEFAICDTGLLIRKIYNFHAKELGLNVLDRRVLVHARFRPKLTQIELAGHLEIEAQNLIRVLDRLSDQGLVERIAHDSDRRAKCVIVTKRGLAVLEELDKAVKQHYAQILGGIDLDEKNALITTLDKLKINLAKTLEDMQSQNIQTQA